MTKIQIDSLFRSQLYAYIYWLHGEFQDTHTEGHSAQSNDLKLFNGNIATTIVQRFQSVYTQV